MSALPAESRPPAFRVLRLPEWRREPERIVVTDLDAGIEQTWNLWTAEVMTGLANGEPYPALVDRIQAMWPAKSRDWCDATVRRFFYTLHRLKAIELIFEAPSSFAGRYHVKKELGRGGVGVAYLCRDEKEGDRDVVVKRAWDYFAPLAKTDALMRQEVAVMRRLDHPGIAKPYDSFEEGGLLHLVREFAQGRELANWRGKGVQPAEVRRPLARAIAEIVEHLHERGFLILDLRPANFFIDEDAWRPILIDVGHCKEHTEGVVELGVPKAGRAHGSPGFAAPETVDLGKAFRATDVWGFGRLYYFMTTGMVPKHGQTVTDLLAKMEGAPDEDKRIVATCAEDEVARRPATMRDAAALFA